MPLQEVTPQRAPRSGESPQPPRLTRPRRQAPTGPTGPIVGRGYRLFPRTDDEENDRPQTLPHPTHEEETGDQPRTPLYTSEEEAPDNQGMLRELAEQGDGGWLPTGPIVGRGDRLFPRTDDEENDRPQTPPHPTHEEETEDPPRTPLYTSEEEPPEDHYELAQRVVDTLSTQQPRPRNSAEGSWNHRRADDERAGEGAADRYSLPGSPAAARRLVEEANWLHALVEDLDQKLGQYPPPSAAAGFAPGETLAPVFRATCAVCMDRGQTVAFAGCGHLCMCIPCARKLVQRSIWEFEASCPVCRTVSVPIALRQP